MDLERGCTGLRERECLPRDDLLSDRDRDREYERLPPRERLLERDRRRSRERERDLRERKINLELKIKIQQSLFFFFGSEFDILSTIFSEARVFNDQFMQSQMFYFFFALNAFPRKNLGVVLIKKRNGRD